MNNTCEHVLRSAVSRCYNSDFLTHTTLVSPCLLWSMTQNCCPRSTWRWSRRLPSGSDGALALHLPSMCSPYSTGATGELLRISQMILWMVAKPSYPISIHFPFVFSGFNINSTVENGAKQPILYRPSTKSAAEFFAGALVTALGQASVPLGQSLGGGRRLWGGGGGVGAPGGHDSRVSMAKLIKAPFIFSTGVSSKMCHVWCH